jgi:folate-dependent tRNA-U54 methylase TrmFO/GidA
LFCIDELTNCEKLVFYDIEDTIAGMSHLVDYSSLDERLTYMYDYETINIIPLLHRTTLNFIGMLPRHMYLATKQIDNKFIALDITNKLTVWNILTGKMIK